MKKYIRYSLIVATVLIIIVVFLSFYYQSVYVWLLCVALFCLLFKPIVRMIAVKSFIPKLTEKLDAYSFKKEIYSNKHFYPPIIYRVLAETYTGNYQSAVNLCTKAEMKANSKNRIRYLFFLAHIYFELDDLVALQKIIEKIDLSVNKNKEKNEYKILCFYHFYIDGKHENCISFCYDELDNLESKNSKYNLIKINTYFKLAVSYYKNGNINDAREWFKKIADTAPKMHISKVSKKYICEIETGNNAETIFEKVYPQSDFQIIESSPSKKLQILKWIGIILIFVAMLGQCITMIIEHKKSEELSEYEKRLYATIDVEYDDFELLGYSNVEIDKNIVDVFAVVCVDERIDILSYGSDQDGSEVTIVRKSNIIINQDYIINSLVGNYSLSVGVYDTDCLENTIVKLKVTYQGESYFFCVTEHISPITQ